METKKSKKRILLLILAVLFVCSAIIPAASCGEKTDGGNQGNDATPDQKETDANGEVPSDALEYVYPEINGDGADFTFLTPTTGWFFYTNLVFENPPDEVLDEAVYKRNRLIEDKFNINIKAVEKDIMTIQADLKKVIASGSGEYDAAFCPAYAPGAIGSMITENMFYNLRDISTVNLDADWWNQTMVKEAAIGGGDKVYYAGSGINIMTLQAVSCVYFNQDMMTNLGLDLPYNAVREGKWTFDLFEQYMKSGTNLNGADSYKWDAGAQTTYGFVSYDDCAPSLIEGSGERFITMDAEGIPSLSIQNERFINVVNKIQSMLTIEGNYMYANTIETGFHYEPIFMNGRALMTMGELKAADVFKEMEATFGILPIPKYEESQKDYYCHLIFQTPVAVIPSSNQDPEFAGAVLDAMAYVSDKDVTPVLFDVSVSQKRLRNEDSIDMLQIIKNSGSFEVGCAYGWTNTFYDLLRSTLGMGRTFDVSSQIEKNKDKINANIDKTMELFD